MAKVNARLESARRAYREALDAARAQPTPEAWARLLNAGKELSSAEDPRARGRRGRRGAHREEAAGPDGVVADGGAVPDGAVAEAVVPDAAADNLESLD